MNCMAEIPVQLHWMTVRERPATRRLGDNRCHIVHRKWRSASAHVHLSLVYKHTKIYAHDWYFVVLIRVLVLGAQIHPYLSRLFQWRRINHAVQQSWKMGVNVTHEYFKNHCWLKHWLCTVKQQVMTCANKDHNLCRHIASLGQNLPSSL